MASRASAGRPLEADCLRHGNEGTFGVIELPEIRGQNQHPDQVKRGKSIEPIFEPIFSARSIAGRDAHRSLKDVGWTLAEGTLEQSGTTTSTPFF
jgi:hypothetical protein